MNSDMRVGHQAPPLNSLIAPQLTPPPGYIPFFLKWFHAARIHIILEEKIST